MKRSGFSWLEFVAGIAGLLIVAAIVIPIFARGRENAKKSSCPNNLKQLGLALAQYTQDWDERLPLIAVAPKPTKEKPYGWADALQPYYKSTQILQCPTEGHTAPDSSPTARGYIDYWSNSRLAAFKLEDTNKPELTVAMGEGNDGSDLTDARYNLSALPAAWINDKNSPVYRHNGGANYAFLDGHVKFLLPAKLGTGPTAQSQHTFSLK